MRRRKVGKGFIDQTAIGNAAFDQRQFRQAKRHGFPIAGCEIVNDHNVMALRQPMLDQIRAKAAGAASNQNTHQRSDFSSLR